VAILSGLSGLGIKTMQNNSLSEKIRHLADSIGIDAMGFAEASEFSDYALKNSKRRDPKLSLPNAKTIIVAGIYIGAVTLPVWTNPWYGRTSRLYLSEFFLDVVKPLEPIVGFLKNAGYQAIVCEGSKKEGSILPLKLAAIRAGLGWQGKHSLLISKKYGTFLALGGIITNADLEHNAQEESDRCRNCDKCQKACPLAALDQPYQLNMKKCMSYQLQNDNLPEQIQIAMENRIGDCEICQQACPWNRKHLDNPLITSMTETFQKKIEDWQNFFYLPDLVELSEQGYREKLGHLNTAISYDIFHRNVLIAMARAKKLGDRGRDAHR
jgi:epoxyqueuosine reductase